MENRSWNGPQDENSLCVSRNITVAFLQTPWIFMPVHETNVYYHFRHTLNDFLVASLLSLSGGYEIK